MTISHDSVSFQLGFGLKQSSPNHRSPSFHFSQAPDECLCPVRHLHAYLNFTSLLHSSRALFVMMTPPHGVAARVTLRQWFSRVLRGAVIQAPPGSARAAVASTDLAKGVSENTVMEAADCSSISSLYANYICLIPANASNGTSFLIGSVQDALLSA